MRAILIQKGYQIKVPRSFEQNLVFDFPQRPLKEKGILLRLRHAAEHSQLTMKMPTVSLADGIKIRDEWETRVESWDIMKKILETLGLAVFFRYEKYRETYSRGDVELMLDETPLGLFMEIEANAAAIPGLVSELNLDPNRCTAETYYQLWQKHSPGTHMVFLS